MAVKIQLKQIRNSRGLSQNQLAHEIGTSVQNIQKIEYGKTKGIQYEILNKLCIALKCQPGDLLVWTPDEGDEGDLSLNSSSPSSDFTSDQDKDSTNDSNIHSLVEIRGDFPRSA